MPHVRVHFSVSLDGYAAGPDQSLDDPLGVGGPRLHEWGFATAHGRAILGEEGAGGQDIRIGGGVATIKQYLRSGRVDELHLAVVPVLLGGGERLFDLDAGLDGYDVVEYAPSASVAHVRLSPAGAVPLERPGGGARG